MKRYVCCGVVRSCGTFKDDKTKQDVAWDNINLHCFVKDDREKEGKEIWGGHETAIIKVKNNFKEIVSDKDELVKGFADLVGCEVYPYYNEFGNVECLKVISIDGKL